MIRQSSVDDGFAALDVRFAVSGKRRQAGQAFHPGSCLSPAGCATLTLLVLLPGEWCSPGMVGSGLAWKRRFRCFFGRRLRLSLNRLRFHTGPRAPLMPQPYLSVHVDAHFDDGLRFPARNAGTGLGHITFASPGERLPAGDPPVFPTGEDVLQGRFG